MQGSTNLHAHELIPKSAECSKENLNICSTEPNNESTESAADGISTLSLSEGEQNGKIYELHYGPLKSVFYSVECPFVWENFDYKINDDEFIEYIEKKLYHPKEWKIFCFKLHFIYIYSHKSMIDKAFQNLEFCEKHLNDKADDDFYSEILEGLNQAVIGSKAHLYFRIGDTDMAENIISKVIPFKELSDKAKAGAFAVQANILYEFGVLGRKEALELAKQAAKLDPDDMGFRRGAWYYLIGKILGQLRRIDSRLELPSNQELKMLEKAVKKNPFPVSLATLAESYREAGTYLHFYRNSHGESQRIINRLLNEAKRLYTMSIDMNDSNASTLRRCGNGLMKLPYKFKDLDLAKKCLEKAVTIHPDNSPALFSLGCMEEKYNKNLEAALNFYQMSYDLENHIAGVFIIQVRFKMDRNYNPLDDCDKYIRKLQESFYKDDTIVEYHIIKGEYHLFLKNDLIEATKEWKKAIEISPQSDNLTNHTCRLSRQGTIINIYHCLQEEIKKAMEKPYTEEDFLYLCSILKLCEEK